MDELRPGNVVFYDLTQVAIGSCRAKGIALCMACPVVDVQAARPKGGLQGGGIHFSEDRLELEDGSVVFGQMVTSRSQAWGPPIDGAYLRSLSQEHGSLADKRAGSTFR